MQDFACDAVVALRTALLVVGQWCVRKSDQDVSQASPGEGAVDGVAENGAGDIALIDVKIRRFGVSERDAARSTVRNACNLIFDRYDASGAPATWSVGVVATLFVHFSDCSSPDDYVLVE